MAKELKVFSGSCAPYLTSGLIIYTVPAGRVAKIEISNLNSSNNGFAGSDLFSIGSFIGPYVQANGYGKFPASFSTTSATYLSSNSGSIGGILKDTGSAPFTPFAIPQYYYLVAEQTFSFPSQIWSAQYSFSVVEEY